MIKLPKHIKYLEMNYAEDSQIAYNVEYEPDELMDNNDMKAKACEIIEKHEHFVKMMVEI